MRTRLSDLVERFVAASHDDPLVLAAGALVGILIVSVAVGLIVVAGALAWAGRPWTVAVATVGALVAMRPPRRS